MQVKEFMTSGAESIVPETNLWDAAARMSEENIGVLPVCRGGRVVGLLTDRDIVVRVVARGLDPRRVNVEQAMSKEPVVCREGDEIGAAARLMERHRIRRIPVLDAEGRLAGMLSLGDFTRREEGGAIAREVLSAVAVHHRQRV